MNLWDPEGTAFSISAFAAGALNSFTFGISNQIAGKVFGFDAACADWGGGYGLGGIVGDLNPRGMIRRFGQLGIRKTDRLKGSLDDQHLDAARRERSGEVVSRRPSGEPYDHAHEVRDAQRGLVNRIGAIKRRLGHPGLEQGERLELEAELSEASDLLDYTEGYLQR